MTSAISTPHLFLSYATADREWALTIADALESAGIRVWIDRRGIPGGTDWARQITQAVRACSGVAVLCSAASVNSRNVRQELQLAWDHDKPMLPLLLEPVEFPDSVAYFLQGRQWIEVHGRADAEWVAEVARALGGSTAELTPAPAQAITAPAPTGNLPSPATALVGREAEVEQIVGLLSRDHVRLVTLTGPGGVGKTRLSIAAAERLAPSFPDGAWFVRLAPLREPDLVVPTIAETLGIRDEGTLPQVERLRSFLRDKRLLLVIDNVEHVIEAASELAGLLTHGSGVKMLATSRTVLRLTGETELLVDPLSTPGQVGQVTAAAANTFASVRLFVQRGASAKPGFALTDENASAIAAICARLDGLPLAIEIAAARVKLSQPSALLVRLEKRLPLLTGGARDLPARQQTLRDAIAWSYDLLSPDEQLLFRRLSVFVGGCTIEAAEMVAGPESAVDVFERLASLVDKSLLRLDEINDEPRFRMLEIIREFASEQLEASSEAEIIRERHADWCQHMLEELAHDRMFRPTVEQISGFKIEQGNIREALRFRDRIGDQTRFLRLVVRACLYSPVSSFRVEGGQWIKRALAVGKASDPVLYGTVLMLAGLYAWLEGDYRRVRQFGAQSLALLATAGNPRDVANANALLGITRSSEGQYRESLPFLEAALAGFNEAGDDVGAAMTMHFRANALFGLGDTLAAASSLERALESFQSLGDYYGWSLSIDYLGLVDAVTGHTLRAAQAFEQSFPIWREVGTTERLSDWLMRVAVLAGRHEYTAQVARLIGAAERLRDTVGPVWCLPERRVYDETIEAAQNSLGRHDYQTAWQEGQALRPEQAGDEGLALLRSLNATDRPT